MIFIIILKYLSNYIILIQFFKNCEKQKLQKWKFPLKLLYADVWKTCTEITWLFYNLHNKWWPKGTKNRRWIQTNVMQKKQHAICKSSHKGHENYVHHKNINKTLRNIWFVKTTLTVAVMTYTIKNTHKCFISTPVTFVGGYTPHPATLLQML